MPRALATTRGAVLGVVVCLLAAIPDARGDERPAVPAPVEDENAEPGTTPAGAAPTAAVPRPHDARGLATPDPSRDESVLRVVARGVLTVPRWLFELTMQPVRGALWAWERYQIDERFRRVFFNETETFGVFPSLFFETGFGLNVGTRLVHRDLFGERESLRFRTGFGGEHIQRYSVRAESGSRFGRVRLALEGELEIRNRERFSGIGDRDLVELDAEFPPLDPLGDGPAIASRYRQRFSRLGASVDVTFRPVTIRLSSGVIDRRLSDEDVDVRKEALISDAYDVTRLPGFLDDVRVAYNELELIVSTRRAASVYRPPVWWSTGWHLRAFGGYAKGLGGDASRFFRYGTDLQRFVNLTSGTRVLALRLYGEGVSEDPGPRMPFTELPRLGGNRLLRGYPRTRFRDRYIAAGSAEYQWEVNNGSYAYLFVDAGRALRDIESGAIDDLRLGFGGGLQINTEHSLLARLLIAGSRDGDLLLNLSFEPAFKEEPWFRRR